MLPREYDTLRNLEDHHWWYLTLHHLAASALSVQVRLEKAQILDAGCGTGGMLKFLSNQHLQWRFSGLDISAEAVRRCHERGIDQVCQGDVASLPYEADTFDAVLSLDVLYHGAVNESQALDEMIRVLKPGGVLLLNLPAFECLRGSHDIAVCGARRYKACHVRELLEKRTLGITMIYYWNTWLFLPLLLWRQWTRVRGGTVPVSDLTMPPCWLNRALAAVGRLDARLSRVLRVFWGSSLLVAAVKKSAPEGGNL